MPVQQGMFGLYDPGFSPGPQADDNDNAPLT